MTKIFVSSRTGQPTAYSEHEVRSMWRRGELTADLYYWQKGMEDWAPLPDYFAKLAQEEAEALPTTPPPLPARKFFWTRLAHQSTAHVRLMLWLLAIISLLAAGTDFLQWQALTGSAPNANALAENEQRQRFMSMLVMVVTLTTQISFLIWVYRASVNSHGFGARGLQFTPGWSIAYFFIPIINFVAPFYVLREIWQVSRSPEAWREQGTPPMLKWWLTWWVSSSLAGMVVFILSLPTQQVPDPMALWLPVITFWSMVGHLLQVPLNLVAHLYVTRVFFNQMRLVEGEPEPEPVEEA